MWVRAKVLAHQVPKFWVTTSYRAFPGPAKLLKQDSLLYQYSHQVLFEEQFVDLMKKQFNRHDKISAYAGFDPTADRLHIGHLITIIAMLKISLLGIQPILLVGGATGQIGDPSFKASERMLLQEQMVAKNAGNLEKTIRTITENVQNYMESKNLLHQKQKAEVILKLAISLRCSHSQQVVGPHLQ